MRDADQVPKGVVVDIGASDGSERGFEKQAFSLRDRPEIATRLPSESHSQEYNVGI